MPDLQKGRRIVGDARNALTSELAKRYERGESIRQLAESTGRSYGFIHRLLRDSGAKMRGRGGATRGRRTA